MDNKTNYLSHLPSCWLLSRARALRGRYGTLPLERAVFGGCFGVAGGFRGGSVVRWSSSQPRIPQMMLTNPTRFYCASLYFIDVGTTNTINLGLCRHSHQLRTRTSYTMYLQLLLLIRFCICRWCFYVCVRGA